jgi:hypothetical protein
LKSAQALNLFMNPYLMWTRHAWKTGEMAMAAAQVITHRTDRMARSGVLPNVRDQREFALMGREKGVAAMESARAMGLPLLQLNQQLASMALHQMMAGWAALASIAVSRNAAQSLARQTRFVNAVMRDSAVGASKLSGSVAHVAKHALIPVHKRVSGNVKRLGKR